MEFPKSTHFDEKKYVLKMSQSLTIDRSPWCNNKMRKMYSLFAVDSIGANHVNFCFFCIKKVDSIILATFFAYCLSKVL